MSFDLILFQARSTHIYFSNLLISHIVNFNPIFSAMAQTVQGSTDKLNLTEKLLSDAQKARDSRMLLQIFHSP